MGFFMGASETALCRVEVTMGTAGVFVKPRSDELQESAAVTQIFQMS